MRTRELTLVWDAVTREPQATVRQIAADTGLSTSTVHHQLVTLRIYRYISQEPGKVGTRRVLMPFRLIERTS